MKLRYRLICAALMCSAGSPLAAQDAATDPEVKQAEKEKAIADARTAAANADKAASDAEAARATAKLGPLATVSREGSVDAGDNSGKLQATLLAAESTRQSAALIVRDLCALLAADPSGNACGDGARALPRLLVYTEADKPNFDAYQAFELERMAIARDLAKAAALKPATHRGPVSAGTFGPGLGVLLSAAGNLFRSDYKLANIELTPSDSLLVRAFVRQAKVAKLQSTIIVPGLYSAPLDLAHNSAIQDLSETENSRDAVAALADGFRRQAAAKPKNKEELDRIVAAQDGAVARFDAFAKKLSTPDDAGRVPIANIARQADLLNGLSDSSRLLVLKADYAGGSTYSRKNFWTFLGGIPFYVSGGSLVGYSLFNAKTGETIYSSSMPQAERYGTISEVTDRFAVPRCSPASPQPVAAHMRQASGQPPAPPLDC